MSVARQFAVPGRFETEPSGGSFISPEVASGVAKRGV